MSSRTLTDAVSKLVSVGRHFHQRGWALGTSGNFSVVLSRRPLRLAITASGAPKGALHASDILACDEHGRVVGRRAGKPSAETLLHIAVARCRGAGAVLHTHSVWSTILSDEWALEEGLTIEGYEMLKGLAGVASHDHREYLPVLENDQDIPRLARRVVETLDRFSNAHAFLLKRHGMYTWGDTLADAERHVEILEFLLETVARTANRTVAARTPGGSSWPL
jgi:methylthioribulose-1-phosphate dehydratase